jgi:hypothetical protein
MNAADYAYVRLLCDEVLLMTSSRLLQLTVRLFRGLSTLVQASARSNHARALLYTKAFMNRLPTSPSRILQDDFTSTLSPPILLLALE